VRFTSALADVAPVHAPAPAGGLLWAVHEGFAAYVSRLADGRVDVDGGAVLQPGGGVLFPFTPDAPVLHGTGAVHFTGHHGLLAVSLAEPAISTDTGSAVLTIADPFSPGHRLAFAELVEFGEAAPEADGPAMHEPGATGTGTTPGALRYAVPRLTEEGADLFLGHYREGTPLAPLAILPATDSATDPADQDT
jgi:hypothetical protein